MPDLMSAKQLARRWGLSHRTLETWRCRNRGPAFLKLGVHVLYKLADVEAFERDRRCLTAESHIGPSQGSAP